MRDEIAMLARQGKTQEADAGVVRREVREPGVLAGRRRRLQPLAWVLPYLLGAAGLVTIVLTARRWSRPAAAAAGRRRDADRSGSRRPSGR